MRFSFLPILAHKAAETTQLGARPRSIRQCRNHGIRRAVGDRSSGVLGTVIKQPSRVSSLRQVAPQIMIALTIIALTMILCDTQ